MTDIKLNLGKRIQELRKSKNITQEQLVEIIGSNTNNLSRIENGKKFLSAEKLSKIAEALQVEVKDLFDFGHHQPKEDLKMEINKILDNHPERLQDFYKIITALIK